MLYKVHFTMELLKNESFPNTGIHSLNTDKPGDIHLYFGRDSEGNKCIDMLELVSYVGIAPVKI